MTLFTGDEKARAAGLARDLAKLIEGRLPFPALALDIGSGDFSIATQLEQLCRVRFVGLEPRPQKWDSGAPPGRVTRGVAHRLPFKNNIFDLVTLISVFEHLSVESRCTVFAEARRVLKPGGLLVCQIPNMYLPVEIHSRLPMIQFLPRSIAKRYYWHFAPIDREWKSTVGIDWLRVSVADLVEVAASTGFRFEERVSNEYPRDAFPPILRWTCALQRLMPLGFSLSFSAVNR